MAKYVNQKSFQNIPNRFITTGLSIQAGFQERLSQMKMISLRFDVSSQAALCSS